MAGIYGILIDGNVSETVYNSFYNSEFENADKAEKKYGQFIFGKSVRNRFSSDRFFYEDPDYIICFEGINYSTVRTPHDFIEEFKAKGNKFAVGLKGVFSGFLFEKKCAELYVFNDQLSTKSIFYYYDPKIGFAFASEMQVLSKILRENRIGLNYDNDGIYSLALYGQLFEDRTVVKEIKRLEYGTVLEFKSKENTVSKNKYYKLNKAQAPKRNFSDVLGDINSLMENAIEQEWRKDLGNGYPDHLTLLSGGMDSRVNAMIAAEKGFKKIVSYTYGDPRSSDVTTAAEIAGKNFYSHLQCNLTNGQYLVDNILENYIRPTDGLTLYSPSATMLHSLKKINLNGYGLLHCGQIGDAAFGSLVRPSFDIIANKDKIGLTRFIKNKNLIQKIESLNTTLQRYQGLDYELFAFEQRIMNGTFTGDRAISNYTDHTSPFYDIDLIDYMFGLPSEYKLKQNIYFQWLEKYHPQTLKYNWERIGRRPNSNFNRKFGGLYKKYNNGAKKFFNLNYDSMNPFSTWMSKDGSIKKQLDIIFESNIIKIEDAELRKDLRSIYDDNVFEFRNKFSVITVLLSIKLHFEK